jgi:hypothetical protein
MRYRYVRLVAALIALGLVALVVGMAVNASRCTDPTMVACEEDGTAPSYPCYRDGRRFGDCYSAIYQLDGTAVPVRDDGCKEHTP